MPLQRAALTTAVILPLSACGAEPNLEELMVSSHAEMKAGDLAAEIDQATPTSSGSSLTGTPRLRLQGASLRMTLSETSTGAEVEADITTNEDADDENSEEDNADFRNELIAPTATPRTVTEQVIGPDEYHVALLREDTVRFAATGVATYVLQSAVCACTGWAFSTLATCYAGECNAKPLNQTDPRWLLAGTGFVWAFQRVPFFHRIVRTALDRAEKTCIHKRYETVNVYSKFLIIASLTTYLRKEELQPADFAEKHVYLDGSEIVQGSDVVQTKFMTTYEARNGFTPYGYGTYFFPELYCNREAASEE